MNKKDLNMFFGKPDLTQHFLLKDDFMMNDKMNYLLDWWKSKEPLHLSYSYKSFPFKLELQDNRVMSFTGDNGVLLEEALKIFEKLIVRCNYQDTYINKLKEYHQTHNATLPFEIFLLHLVKFQRINIIYATVKEHLEN